MSRYTFALAEPGDDPQLRRRMAEDWMQGEITVSFRREPDYFAGCHVQGESFQIVKCVDKAQGQIVGLGSRLIRQGFVNGQKCRLGYLADLRVHPEHRSGTLLARGFRFQRHLHTDDPVPLYFTMILSGNASALDNLVGGRAGLPHYRDLGSILTPAIRLDLPKPTLQIPNVQFMRGRQDQLPNILQFVNRCYARKQFAPCYQLKDFGTSHLRGLQAEHYFLAVRANRLVGTVAVWDQKDFRQTHVERYSPALDRLRPLYNLISKFTPLKPLPEVGQAIPHFYLASIAIENDDPQLFRGLMRTVYREYKSSACHYFIVGLHERDPLAPVLHEYRRIEASGRLFAVHYPDSEASFAQLDDRVPYIEIATL